MFKLKKENGFTGADVTVAVLIVTVFASIIATLYSNYSNTSKMIERKAEATRYAVETIETIKGNSENYFNNENATKNQITVYDNTEIGSTGYARSAIVEDYATYNTSATPGIAKIVRVKVSYKANKQTNSVELETVISKEGNV